MSELNSASYSFLPWLKQGLENYTEEGNLISAGGSLVLNASVFLNDNNPASTATVAINLVGPGDIIGIQPRAIINTLPQANEINFESYNLAAIEFYEEDFPWRYTPAKADSNGRLAPWVFLLVLEEDEFELIQDSTVPLPALRVYQADVFPDPTSIWAWAHVHVNAALADSTAEDFLNGELKNNPDLAFSRILSPRRLRPGVTYHAFLIPSFEAGRLAGLSQEIPANISPLQIAWDKNAPDDEITEVLFPVYYQWSFRTGQAESFEYEVRKLQALDLSTVTEGPLAEVNGQDLDMSDVGYNIHVPASIKVNLEGALQIPGTVSPSLLNIPEFQNPLRELLNLTQERLANGAVNPGALTGDPVVAPPIYGQWHAAVTNLPDPGNTPGWLQSVNLHPRYRAIAGIGSRIVQQNQEEYVRRAWEQLGDLPAVNNFLRNLQAGTQIGLALKNKFLANGLTDRTLLLMGPALSRINTGEASSVENVVKKSAVPAAIFDGAFRKIAKPLPVVGQVSHAPEGTTTTNLISKLDEKQISAAAEKPVTTNLSEQEPYYYPFLQADFAAFKQQASFEGFSIDGKILSVEEASKLKTAIDQLPDIFSFTNATQNQTPELAQTKASVLASIDLEELALKKANAAVITRPVAGEVGTSNFSVQQIGEIQPLSAYPYFNQPMYEALKNYAESLFLPGISQIPQNTVTVLQVNEPFVEAFMIGLNHEMAAELLWREFPTDQRGSYFRQFWDTTDYLNSGLSEEEKTDILPLHTWPIESVLGEHKPGVSQHMGSFILLLRGDLLKKFPNVIIYAQEVVLEEGIKVLNGQKKFPVYRADLVSDITILMFDLSAEAVSNSLGWYFVFGERPGQPRFGLGINLEVPLPTDPNQLDPGNPTTWEAFSWQHLPANGRHLNVIDLYLTEPDEEIATIENSAHLAYALFRQPVSVALSISDFIPSRA